MRSAALALCLVVLLAGPVRAQGIVSAPDRDAIEHVINAQIDAFRHDDGAAAFNYASPHIQSMFGDAATFLAMVKQSYAPVTRPRSVTFGALEQRDGQLVQHVELFGPDGEDVALYTMEREPDGTWRIAGCELVRSQRIET